MASTGRGLQSTRNNKKESGMPLSFFNSVAAKLRGFDRHSAAFVQKE